MKWNIYLRTIMAGVQEKNMLYMVLVKSASQFFPFNSILLLSIYVIIFSKPYFHTHMKNYMVKEASS